ncbi:Bifurcating (FeFe) hydrogenase gamma subunit [Desulfarculales bacterium]
MSGTEVIGQDIEVDFSILDRIINDDFGGNRETMIMMMQAIQQRYRFLPEAALRFLSQSIGVPLIKIYEVATFYASFSLDPKGKHIVQVCTGTACHLKGSYRMVGHVCEKKGVEPGGTSPDRMLTLETVNCVGACAVAPVVVIDEKYYPKADTNTLNKFFDSLNAQ